MPFGREGENLYVWYLGFKLTQTVYPGVVDIIATFKATYNY